MIIKMLGIVDIFIGVCFWLFGIFNIIPDKFILLLGFILLAKGVIFVINLNIVSILDIFSALVIILASASDTVLPNLVVIIVTLFLIQKGIFSMFS